MEKTLKYIQTFSKIGQILSKVVFVASIVGAVCCAVGFICLQWTDVLVLGRIKIHGPVEWAEDMALGNAYAATFCTFIVLMGEIFVANYAAKVFSHELTIGNPFDLQLSKEVFKLGILVISVSAGTSIAAAITYEIIKAFTETTEAYKIDFGIQLGFGLSFIFISQLLKYGALIKGDSDGKDSKDIKDIMNPNNQSQNEALSLEQKETE